MKLMSQDESSLCGDAAPSQSLFRGGITVRILSIQVICAVTFLFLRGVKLGSDVTLVGYEGGEGRSRLNLRSSSSSSGNNGSPLDQAEDVHFDVPSCARDVFVALHKVQREDQTVNNNGGTSSACSGLLIRDDIILTTKECSRHNHTFNFASVGTLQATPHASLNEELATKKLLDTESSADRLGFLLANPPYHYHFINEPVRRTRMFLSHRPAPTVFAGNGTTKTITQFIKCKVNKPIAHGFPVVNDNEENDDQTTTSISLADLRSILPTDILWEDTDLQTAPEFKYKDYRWWSRRIRKSEEVRHIRSLLEEYTGPRGSVSFYSAGRDTVERMSLVMEALDPHGHRRDCWPNYYERWLDESPFSGEHFFDWLDFGKGKFLLERNKIEKTLKHMHHDDLCMKKQFNGEKVHYFDDDMRKEHEVYFEPSNDGTQLVWRYKHTNEFVPKSPYMDEIMDKEEESFLYMFDMNKTFYVVDDTWDEDRYDIIKHTGILAGRPAISAGEVYIRKKGVVWGIDCFSGHYRPNIEAATMMYQHFKDMGYNTTAIHWIGVRSEKWGVEKCKRVKWDKIEVPGFDVKELERSCFEMTTSPTWLLKDEE